MNIEFGLTDEQLNDAIQAAMLAALSDSVREDLVRRAIDNLTKRQSYNADPPIQQAFDQAVHRIATNALENDPTLHAAVDRALSSLVADVVAKAVADDAEMRAKVLRVISNGY